MAGDVVATENNFDVGLVAETSHGRPVKVFSKYVWWVGACVPCPEYGGTGRIDRHRTGIRMTLEECIRLSRDTRGHLGFYRYWRGRLSPEP